jgi:hypothetical protein
MFFNPFSVLTVDYRHLKGVVSPDMWILRYDEVRMSSYIRFLRANIFYCKLRQHCEQNVILHQGFSSQMSAFRTSNSSEINLREPFLTCTFLTCTGYLFGRTLRRLLFWHSLSYPDGIVDVVGYRRLHSNSTQDFRQLLHHLQPYNFMLLPPQSPRPPYPASGSSLCVDFIRLHDGNEPHYNNIYRVTIRIVSV